MGAVGTLVFGIRLALDDDAYPITDGWILTAIVLWVVGPRAAVASRGRPA